MKQIKLIVNGQDVSLPEVPGEMLSDLLRYRLGLTGTKIGCNEDECGSCTVLIDGEPILSCSYPAAKAHGKLVLTVEGLASQNGFHHGDAEILEKEQAKDKKSVLTRTFHAATDLKENAPVLHPLQQAFIQYGAVQCGFCIPGQLMTAYALLARNPDPSEADIKEALKDTLCRCAGYPSIIHAIQAAGEAMRTGNPVRPPEIPLSSHPHKAVGTLVPRLDAMAKVTGKAIYSDDIQFEGMLQARVKRAMVPSAIVLKIDTTKARALPGVVAVLTADDIPGKHNHGLVIDDWPVMVGVGEKVNTVGDAVAIVAAETREIATQALDLIDVELQALPVVSDPVQAHQPDAPAVHPTGNLLDHIKVRKGNMEQGFAQAEVVLEHTFHTPMHDHAFIEPECSIARPTEDGRIEIYVGSQIPYSDRIQVARTLGVPETQVRILGQLIGGGFGGKEDIAGQIDAALLAQVTGRPVKLLYDRHESLLTHPKRHATQISREGGGDA